LKKYFSSYWIRSAFYSFLQRFSITIFGFINYFILTRTLSQSQLGTWGLFLIITGIFEAAKSNLLKNAHVKYVSMSSNTDERTVIASSSFLINASITCLFVLLILVFSNWLSVWFKTGPELAYMLKWFIPGLVCMIFFAHLEAVQQSHLDFKGGFAGYLIRQVSFFGVILVYKLFKIPISLAHLAMYQSLTIGLGTVILYLFTKKYLFYQFRASKLWVKRIMGYGGYIFGSGMVATVAASVDQFMIARILNPAAAAYYGVAARINLLVDIPSYAASEIIFPKASRAVVEEGKERVKYLFEKMVSVLIAFTIPVAIVIISFPRLITIIIASRTYLAAATILQLYMVAGIIRPVQNQAANLLNSMGKTRLVFFMNTLFLVLLILMNYTCLIQFGFYGAAIGTLISSLLNFIFWYFIMKKEINLDLSTVFVYTIDTYRKIFKTVKSFLSGTKKEAEYL
jgi:O-antigen/teichoic acid export membrane protein